MRVANGWKQYRILDTSQLEKLENWHGVTLVRPDPQIIWKTPKKHPAWNRADGHYSRSSSGGGSWAFSKKLPPFWEMEYEPLGLTFKIQPTGFKHTGLFPEQAVNWDFAMKIHTCIGLCLKKFPNTRRKSRTMDLIVLFRDHLRPFYQRFPFHEGF